MPNYSSGLKTGPIQVFDPTATAGNPVLAHEIELPGSTIKHRVYASSPGAGPDGYILTENARWDGSNWVRDNDGSSAYARYKSGSAVDRLSVGSGAGTISWASPAKENYKPLQVFYTVAGGVSAAQFATFSTGTGDVTSMVTGTSSDFVYNNDFLEVDASFTIASSAGTFQLWISAFYDGVHHDVDGTRSQYGASDPFPSRVHLSGFHNVSGIVSPPVSDLRFYLRYTFTAGGAVSLHGQYNMKCSLRRF